MADPEMKIPESVTSLLQPISEAEPAGVDTSGSDLYQRLQFEIEKTTPDYDKCWELAEQLTRSKTKDLHLVIWVSFIWYRKRGPEGLRDGLLLVLFMLRRFRETLHPRDSDMRARAFAFFARKSLARMMKAERPEQGTGGAFKELQHVLRNLVAETQAFQTDKMRTTFGDIQAAVDGLVASGSGEVSPSAASGAESSAPERPAANAATAGVQSAIVAPSTFSGDPLAEIRRQVRRCFESEPGVVKSRRIPDDPVVFGISRLLEWGKLATVPPDGSIEGPVTEKRQFLEDCFRKKDWERLIPDIEIRFLEDEAFRFWLDAQRYVVRGLQDRGAQGKVAGDEIMVHLSRLLQRIPDIIGMKFKGKKGVSYADKETSDWILDEVLPLTGGEGKDRILPPVVDEEYADLGKEYEKACVEMPPGFEAHANAMQKGIAAETRPKGRFLRLLHLANLSVTAREYRLAKGLLDELLEIIEKRGLSEWEPALCLATWQSMYLVNQKLRSGIESDLRDQEISRQQDELFRRITATDCIRGMKLIHTTTSKGA